MFGLEVMHFACDHVKCGAWGGVNPFVPTKCHVHNVCSNDGAVNQYITPSGVASNLKYMLFSKLQHVKCLINEFYDSYGAFHILCRLNKTRGFE